MSDRSASRSRSRSASRGRSPDARSLSRSRSRGRRSDSEDDRRSRSARRASRSASPRRQSRSRSRSRARDWRKILDSLIDRGLIRSSDVDNRAMDALEDLGDDAATNAVERFAEANFSRINNKNGFLMGIIRRVQEDGPDRGNVDLDILPRSVRYKLRDIMDDGRISKNDVDARMLKALADLPVDLGCEAVEKFAMASLDSVRSKTGFMMGIIKRIQEDLSGRYRGGGYRDTYDRGYGGGGGGRYGDRYDRGYGGGGSRYGGGGYGGGYSRY
ncbi:probable heterogeneous nuclear ribonucleoprotein Q at N-terminal half [Coccomyxa sp. Obi]|nr:probable heterogeneous nuclear ribonucleoprotein Q at N-terminal half [Coccomyxa sp. Obi]